MLNIKKSMFYKFVCVILMGGLFLGSLVSPVSAQSSNYNDEFNRMNEASLTTISGTFSDYIPYSQFNNYQYLGFGTNFENQYTILEYTPDENGRFQIVILINGQAIACVYQQRNNGLFELARFENYGEVEDLRYADAVQNGKESLILSSNLTVGYQYYSGFNNEYIRTIKGILPTYEKNGAVYQEVVAIQETGYGDGSSTWYYLAPKYGIICIERVDSAGNRIAETSLHEVYNVVYTQ